MGFFRRYKLTDYSADECREEMLGREKYLAVVNTTPEGASKLMEEWACFRELLARHEGKNKPPPPQSPPNQTLRETGT